MGEKIYYISQVLIFSATGVVALINPEFVAKNIFKSDANIMLVVGRLMGVVALLNVARCLKELFK